MLMPLLVRLTDSQVDVADGVVSEVLDRIHHGRRISKQVSSGRLTIDQEALLPNLHIKQVYRDIQPGGQFRGAERAGVMRPSVALRRHVGPGAEPDPLDGDRQDLFRTIGRAVPLAGENGGDFIVGHAGAREAAERLHGDDTTVPVLAKGKTDTGRCRVYVRDDAPFGGAGPPAAIFYYSRDRRGEHPQTHLAGYAGILQADAYNGYNRLYLADRKPGPIREAADTDEAGHGFQ
jgi:hypothetical protein